MIKQLNNLVVKKDNEELLIHSQVKILITQHLTDWIYKRIQKSISDYRYIAIYGHIS